MATRARCQGGDRQEEGDAAVLPTATALDGTIPSLRPLFYSHGTPTGPVKEFLDWTLSPEGQAVVQQVGYVPAPAK
jgi:phosphate transport system substrate-binding protein